MKKASFYLMALLVVCTASAQQSGDFGSKQNAKVSDLSPPIPIVKDIVDSVVNEQRAYILTPAQIDALKRSVSEARRANVSPYPSGQVAKPTNRAFDIEPGSRQQQPRMLRLWQGAITSVVFSDHSGNPWLIRSVSFDCSLFNDGGSCGNGQSSKQASNILKMWPMAQYAYGNVVVELEGLASPVVFMLSTGQSDENDVSVEVRVAGRNPNAKPQTISLEKMPEHDGAMGYFLDGLAPHGAVKLVVGGGDAEAWQLNGALYVRTRLSILSPAFMNRVGSPDGISVFKYYSVVPTLLASLNGKTLTLSVSGN
jgi:intracellular multiplication protein IcmK